MEFLKGALVAGFWSCLVSFLLALAVVTEVVVFSQGWDRVAFVAGMVVMMLVIGVWVVPISVFLGLVYVIIRRAAGEGRECRSGVVNFSWGRVTCLRISRPSDDHGGTVVLVVSQLWNQKGRGGGVWFEHPGF